MGRRCSIRIPLRQRISRKRCTHAPLESWCGTVNINPTDPSSGLLVNWRTLSNPLDNKAAVRMIRFSRRFDAVSSFSGRGPVELSPGSNATSDAAIEEFLRSIIDLTLVRMVGTESMFLQEYGGVVGTDLEVYGVGKLSVVDASVVDASVVDASVVDASVVDASVVLYLPATHLCTTVYAIAEKAADAIKARIGWDE